MSFLLRVTAALLAAGACGFVAASSAQPAADPPARRPPMQVKVLIVTMFAPEAEAWTSRLEFPQRIDVPGLSAAFPWVRCTRDQVCLVTTGMGHANAAASMMALALDPRFDLGRAYVFITGIAGIDPEVGTLGSVAWARWLVDFGLQHEIDARELPPDWDTGYFGIGAKSPDQRPPLDYHTEVFRLDERLLQRVYGLTRHLQLADSDRARAYRTLYPQPAARGTPAVMQCDTVAGDTWWHGERLGRRAAEWTRILTGGGGRYCTTQQEDNATYEALVRAAAAGRLDLRRVAVLRAGANFDRPHPWQSDLESLQVDSGGFPIALENLYRAAAPVVADIVRRWDAWGDGVPPI